MKRLFILLSIIFLGVSINNVDAQLTMPRAEAPDDNLTVSLDPEYPGPFEEVTITAESSWFDTQTADVSWSQNGRIVQSGRGLTKYKTELGDLGQKTTLTITVTRPGGRPFSSTISIYPADTDIVWQALTYTPPFYKGKAIPSFGGDVQLTALPRIQGNGGMVPKENLNYLWSADGRVLGSQSGYGKYSLRLPVTFTREYDVVEVLVSLPNTNIQAAAKIQITPKNPVVRIYNDHPLFGLQLEQALTNKTQLSGEESSFKAIPFFFSAPIPTLPDLEYKWNMNGKEVSTGSTPDTIVLRREGNVSGEATINVEVNHPQKSFQFNQAGFTLNFGSNE